MTLQRLLGPALVLGVVGSGTAPAAFAATLSANPDLGFAGSANITSSAPEATALVSAEVDAIIGEDEILDLFTVGASFNRFENSVRKRTTISEVTIGSIPIVSDPIEGAEGSFLELLFDAREDEAELQTRGGIVGARAAKAVDSIIDQLVFEVNGTTIFDADLADNGPLVVLDTALTGNALLTDAPDLAFYIPVSSVMDVGATTMAGGFDAADTLSITWRQSGGTGLNERWVLRGCGDGVGFAGECYSASFSLPAPLIGNDDDMMAMPIPGGLPLMLSGLAGLAVLARRRRG